MLWNGLYKAKQIKLDGFGHGLNTAVEDADISPQELTDCLNVTCDDYPVIRTRNDRVLQDCDALTVPKGIGARGSSQMHAFDNNTWKYRALNSTSWTDIGTAISTASTQCSFHEFHTYTLTTDNTTGQRLTYTIAAFSNSSNMQNGYWTEDSTFAYFTTSYAEPSSGSTYTNYPPQSNLMTVHKYRVYGFDKDYRTLRFSELGNPLWYKAENYLDITEMKGQAKAITAYADHVIVWGEKSMHELYGESNFNFELINVSNNIGCVGKYAFCECKSRLYWLSDNGFYMYTGGIPRQFGIKAKKYFDEINWDLKKLICMGTYESKIYTAVPIKPSTSNNRLIVIDVEGIDQGYELVTIEDDANIDSFVNINRILYGLNKDGRVWNICSTYKTGYDNSTAISWKFETKPLTDDSIALLSAIRDVWIEHQGSTNATLNLKYTTNSHSTTFSTFMATTDFTTNSTSILRDKFMCSSTELQGMTYVKWQFSGSGFKKIYGLLANICSYGDIQ